MVSQPHAPDMIFSGSRIRLEARGRGLLAFRLCRPDQHNAIDETLMRESCDALAAASRLPEREARLLLLEAEGRSFCAGADIEAMRAQADADPASNAASARLLSDFFAALAAVPCPTLALVQGAAVGGGLGLVACCDLVLAVEKAVFATSEVLLGVVPAVISPYVVRRIGPSHSQRIMLSGERLSAAQAREMGLVTEVVADEAALAAAAAEWIRKLLLCSPAAQRRTKALLRAVVPLPDAPLREFLCGEIAAARASADGKEGLSAFLNKTKPAWTNPT